jgi:hypothetical protein
MPIQRRLRDAKFWRLRGQPTASVSRLPHGHFGFGPIHAGGQSMAQESKTPQAGTIFRAHGRALSRILFNAFTFTGAVVSLSMIVFLLDSTSEQVNTLLTSQNAAALKLWNNVDYYEHHKPSDIDDPPLPPGLVNDVVEFSRTNANIKKVAHRLVFSHIFESDNAQGEMVSPRSLDSKGIKEEAIKQIETYQKQRADVQDHAALDKTVVAAISTYVLPCLYALLGTFLYTGRSRTDGKQNERVGEHGDRYAMAFILGATVSLFSSLMPKDVLLSPLAVAFLAGYSIDVFTSRLDALVEKMKLRPAIRSVRDGRDSPTDPVHDRKVRVHRSGPVEVAAAQQAG